jgi:hypothetical protein
MYWLCIFRARVDSLLKRLCSPLTTAVGQGADLSRQHTATYKTMSRLKELYAQLPAADDALSPAPVARLVAIAKQCGDEEVKEVFDRIRELAEIRSDPERDDWDPDDVFTALNNLTTILYAVPHSALHAVLEGLASDSSEVRYRVALALNDRGDRSAASALEQTLRTEQLDHIRKALTEALASSAA